MPSTTFSRRTLFAGTAATAMHCLVCRASEESPKRNKICAFVKFIQSLNSDQMAETVAELGFDGIEATIRGGGQVLPEHVEDGLPKLVEALKKHGLEITIMASNVNRVDQPHTEKVLRTAASLGVKRYRMAYYRYDPDRPVLKQLDELRPVIKDLVALNRELGISAVYQNHAGAGLVGCTIWDLHYLMKDYPVSDIGLAYDIRHATVEGGLAWPLHFNLMRPHLAAVYFKDFVWEGRRVKNVPLGTGQIDPAFYGLLKKSKFDGPISLHVEYLPDGGLEKNIDALKKDVTTLKASLAS